MQESLSARVANKVASVAGSWRFIIFQTGFILLWIAWNTCPGVPHFDTFPFVLLNLFIGFQAAYTGPFVLMSQNASAEKDHELVERMYALEQQIAERDEKMLAMMQYLAYGKGDLHVGVSRRSLQPGGKEQGSDLA